MDSAKPSFALQGQDEAFSARRDSIFGNLPVLELTHKEVLPKSSSIKDVTVEEDLEKSDDTSSYKGEESMFKRPMPKLRRSSHVPRKFQKVNKIQTPDHKQNPHKWIKYNLSATSEVTDKSNTAAAFSFLRELEERKRKLEPTEASEESPADPSGKIVFKKPKVSEKQSSKVKTYRDGKLCMPAFEFGSSSKIKSDNTKKRTHQAKESPSQKKKSAACLSHLQEEESDEDE